MSFEFFANLIENDGSAFAAIERAMKELRETEVLVGIPEEKASRKDEGEPTNVELMYIHSHGSPLNRIPARPVIEPAISDAKERLGAILADAAKSAMDGDINGMTAAFNEAGLAGEMAAKNWFLNPKNGWKQNADSIIEAKEQKTRRAAKAKKGETVVSDPKPLIDTGEFRRSITYVVRKNK